MSSRIRACILLAGLLFVAKPSVKAQGLSADLAMIPTDAVVMLHFRVADLWKHDLMIGLRDTIAAAGPKAVDAFEKQVYPHPGDLDRITVFLTLNEENRNSPPNVVIVVAMKKDVDGERIRKLYLPEAAEKTISGKKIAVDSDKEIALYLPDAKHMLLGPPKSIESYLTKAKGTGGGSLSDAIAQANSKIVTIAVNVKGLPIPPQAYDEIPPAIRPLAATERILLTIDVAGPSPVIELKAGYASDAAATDAEKAIKAAVAMVKQQMKEPREEMEKQLFANADKGPQSIEQTGMAGVALLAIGAMNRMQDQLDKLPITRSGSDLSVKVSVPTELVPTLGVASAGIGLLLPAVAKVRSAAGASVSQNNLKQIGLAMHNFNDRFNKLPSSAICSKDGKPLLSWRVAILPFIEQEVLYRQFKLDEPWDSPNNKPLIEKMPKIYASPRVEAKPGMTVYKVFVGKEAIFSVDSSKRLTAITDGTSNTLMTAEAGEPVIWTKPEDIEVDMNKPLPKLDLPNGLKIINVGLADGSVHRIDLSKVDEKTLKAYIGAADGLVVPSLYDSNRPAFETPPKTANTPPVISSEVEKPSSPGKPPR